LDECKSCFRRPFLCLHTAGVWLYEGPGARINRTESTSRLQNAKLTAPYKRTTPRSLQRPVADSRSRTSAPKTLISNGRKPPYGPTRPESVATQVREIGGLSCLVKRLMTQIMTERKSKEQSDTNLQAIKDLSRRGESALNEKLEVQRRRHAIHDQ